MQPNVMQSHTTVTYREPKIVSLFLDIIIYFFVGVK